MTRSLVRNKFVDTQSLFKVFIPLLLSFLFIFTSCSKPAGVIGVGIQPEDSKLNLGYVDTTTVYAYSSPKDSVRSDFLSWNGIGSIKDPVFGHTNAGFYTQFFLSSTNQYFGDERVMDSLVLQLAYSGIIGDTNTPLTAHVYEMLEGIEPETPYYSNLQLQINPDDYGNITFLSNPFDSVVIGSDTLRSIVRLNISNNNPALAEKLLAAEIDDMEDNDTFLEYFKGLFVIGGPVDNDGSIAQFNLTSPLSKMTLYYHNSVNDTLHFDYNISTSSVRVSKYEHDFSTGEQDFNQQVVDGDTALGTEKFYIQGLGGVKATIKIPHIAELKKLGANAINEAKLELNGYEKDTVWTAPPQLSLYAITEDGSEAFIDDYYEGENYFGGEYKSSSNSYTFRITRFIQSLISDPTKENYGLSLYIISPWVVPNRFIFNGNVSDSTGIQLKILYTELD